MRRRTVCALGGLVTLVSGREDLMPLRGSYLSLVRQVDALERRAERVAVAAGGCPTCAGWPEVALCDATEESPSPWDGPLPGRPGWPESLVCPSCSRQPPLVLRLVYADAATTAVHLSDWAPGDTS